MEKVNNTVKIHVQIITFLIIWFIVLLLFQLVTPFDLWKALKKVPQAISIYVILGIIFTKWIWKWRIFQGWLIKIPNLQGTWKGELQSDWINPETQKGIPPIEIIFVIKQTFNTLSCNLFTKESSSYSTAAEINCGQGGSDLCLTFNYTNRPKATLRDRSQIHDGAAILRIIKNPKGLEGEYWTSRKTRGDISLEFYSNKLKEKFT